MKMIFHITICFVLIHSMQSYAQTLDDYLVEAAENNPGLKANYLEFEAAMQKTSQVKALPDPVLSFGYFVSPIETRVGPQRAKFSLVQMFPWFGTNGAKKEASELNTMAKYQEFLDNKNELFFKVKTAYYPIVEIREKIKWQQENLKLLKTYKQISTTNFSNNKGTMVDVIRVDIMIQDAITELDILEKKLNPLEVAFNRLLNRPDSMFVESGAFEDSDQSNIHFNPDSVLVNNIALKAIDLKIKEAHARESVSDKQGLPSFGLGIDYMFMGERTDIDVPDNGKNAFMPMVTMSLPLFRGKYKASVKEAQFLQSSLTHRKKDMENNLITSFEMAKYDLTTSEQLNALYDDQIMKTKLAVDLLYTAYSNSGGEFEEVLRMEQQLLKYKMSKAAILKDYYVAAAKLEYLTAKSE